MWLLRLLAVILVIAIGAGFLAFAITGKRHYLNFSFRALRYGVIFALIVFALLFVERLAILPI